jgi:serine/threonine protein kinase
LVPKLNKDKNDSNEYNSSKVSSKSMRKSFVLPTVTINDFQIGKMLGEGRFGSVHQVIHKSTGAIFALKKIPK